MSSDAIKEYLLENDCFENHTEKQIKRVSKKKIDNNIIRIFKSTISNEQWLVVSDINDNYYYEYPYASTSKEWKAYVAKIDDDFSDDLESKVPAVFFLPIWYPKNKGYSDHLSDVLIKYLKFFDKDTFEEIQENTFVPKNKNLQETVDFLISYGFNVILCNEDFSEITQPINFPITKIDVINFIINEIKNDNSIILDHVDFDYARTRDKQYKNFIENSLNIDNWICNIHYIEDGIIPGQIAIPGYDEYKDEEFIIDLYNGDEIKNVKACFELAMPKIYDTRFRIPVYITRDNRVVLGINNPD